jgi:transposase
MRRIKASVINQNKLNSEASLMEDCEKKGVQEITACVGLDWADEKHDYKLQAPSWAEPEGGEVKHTSESLIEWVGRLRQRFPERKIAIALEQSRGALAYLLMRFDFLVLYFINPKGLAKFREAFRVSGAKDDPDDAGCLLSMILLHRDKLRPWMPDDPQTRKLRLLTEYRRDCVDRRTALTNQLTSMLKNYFPQSLSWIGDLTSTMAGDFLTKWPTLDAVKKARPTTLRKFYHEHHSRSAEVIERRIGEIAQAAPFTEDPSIIDPCVLAAQTIIQQIPVLNAAIEKFDQEIKAGFAAHPDQEIFSSFPGAGDVMAPRLLVSIGSNRDRYQDAKELQQFSGIAPVTKRSGNSITISRRLARPVFVAQSFHEFALHSIPLCPWAAVYYKGQRDLGKSHHCAVRALAYKWIRIIFRCWQLRKPYDEQTYLNALIKRNSPLAAKLKSA